MNPLLLKPRIGQPFHYAIGLIVVLFCAALFYFALFFAKENEKREEIKLIATIRFYKQILVDEG